MATKSASKRRWERNATGSYAQSSRAAAEASNATRTGRCEFALDRLVVAGKHLGQGDGYAGLGGDSDDVLDAREVAIDDVQSAKRAFLKRCR